MDRFKLLVSLLAPGALNAAGVTTGYAELLAGLVTDAESIAGASGADKKARVMEAVQREIGVAQQNPAETVALVGHAVDTLIALVNLARKLHP